MNRTSLVIGAAIQLGLLCVVTVPAGTAGNIYEVDYESQADVKVAIVDYESQADLCVWVAEYESQARDHDEIWYYVKYESQADAKVFRVRYESQADVKVFFVKYESQAGWRRPSPFQGRLGAPPSEGAE